MHRRTFLSLSGGLAMEASAAVTPARARYFRLERYLLEQGDQGARLAA